jgi:hypothetical protein
VINICLSLEYFFKNSSRILTIFFVSYEFSGSSNPQIIFFLEDLEISSSISGINLACTPSPRSNKEISFSVLTESVLKKSTKVDGI